MAFFKSFQQNLPSVNISSILDSVTSRVDDLANAVSDATYAVSDQLSEQVTTVIKKVHEEEDGESNGSGQGAAQTSTAQEGKGGGKSMWPMNRDAETSSTASKNNQTSDSAEADRTQSQMEWEWRDGCWRVKKTEAELAEEERKKKEEKELQEKREQRRRERREKQLEKEAQRKKEEEREGEEEAEEKTDEGRAQGRKMSDSEEQSAAQQGADDCADAPHSPETESRAREKKPKEEGEEEEGVENGVEREGDDEEEAELPVPPSTVKKKKSDKKKKKGKDAKEDSKKPGKASDVEKKKEKGKKSKKKKKGNQEGVLSDSEEDRGLEATAQQNTTSAWSSERKQSSEQGGYSSEASSEHAANSIQRIKKDSSLNELQPPPYQDKGSAPRVSSRSERGVRRGSPPQRCDSPRGSSEASGDQDTESYLNKGCEEDIPSDSTAVLGPEDGCGLQLPTAYEPEPLAKYGTLDVAFEYDSSEQWLAVTVTAATDIPALKQTGNISWQVHLVLLPTKKQRAKTGVQKGPCPIFTETFKFSRVEQEALGDYAVRFRLYSIRRMKKEKVLGEKVFYLTKLNLQGKIALPVTLEPGSELAGCGSVVSVSRSAGAMTYRSTEDSSLPEILLGLIYNSATGRLSAEVIQGSHFKTTASDKPVNGLFCCIKHFVGGQLYIMRDTYVKLTMLDSKGKEMSKCKTAVCRGQPNPTYKETFMFQVALFQLSEVSLVVSVFCRRSSMKPRERLGCVSLGLNSTGEEQQAHWTEMKDAEGQQVCHWHTLTDT
ncbi:synaptotagmin-14 isoform X1 [Hippoglossus stenolepis]|uniref:synaptotagmin-14 isoform X1 n=1 Tax=Hippoglossus stenolepis TaxID=195615 RepID=UPI001837854F|nr:synaptotagmin-14 isoform X1 [Hippoglossus stenolepis]